ncbi:MAG: hypothetical protein WBX00_25045 [Isosphaeraceae bacterium]
MSKWGDLPDYIRYYALRIGWGYSYSGASPPTLIEIEGERPRYEFEVEPEDREHFPELAVCKRVIVRERYPGDWYWNTTSIHEEYEDIWGPFPSGP